MIDGHLATIRGLSHRIAEESDPGKIQALTRDRAQHERAVRLAWAATSGAGGRTTTASPSDLVEHLADRILVQLVNVDDTLYAVVVRDGRWRTVEVGPLERAQKAMDRALYGLRSATRGRPIDLSPLGTPAGDRACWDPWLGCCRRTERWWSRRPRHSSVLRGGLLPSLHDRPVALTPSATAWVRAHKAVASVRASRLRGRSRTAHGWW